MSSERHKQMTDTANEMTADAARALQTAVSVDYIGRISDKLEALTITVENNTGAPFFWGSLGRAVETMALMAKLLIVMHKRIEAWEAAARDREGDGK